MTSDKHIDTLRAILTGALRLDLDGRELAADTALTEGGLDLDSVQLMELITAVEERFGFQFNDEDFRPATFRNLGTLWQVIEKSRASRS